jgi:hypothetical protein
MRSEGGMTEQEARALYRDHCQPGDRGTLEHYGEKAAVAAILAVTAAHPATPQGEEEDRQIANCITAIGNLSLHIREAHAAIEALMTALGNGYHPAYQQGRKVLAAPAEALAALAPAAIAHGNAA